MSPAGESTVVISWRAAAWLLADSVPIFAPARVTPGRFDHSVRLALSVKARFTAASSVADSVARKPLATQIDFASCVVAVEQSIGVTVPSPVVVPSTAEVSTVLAASLAVPEVLVQPAAAAARNTERCADCLRSMRASARSRRTPSVTVYFGARAGRATSIRPPRDACASTAPSGPMTHERP